MTTRKQTKNNEPAETTAAPAEAAEQTGVAAVVDEVKERFTREWESLRTHAKAAFEKLSEEDLESVKGHFDELRQRVVKAYGYAEERAHEEVEKLLHRGAAKAAPAKSEAGAPKEKHSKKKLRGGHRRARSASAATAS